MNVSEGKRGFSGLTHGQWRWCSLAFGHTKSPVIPGKIEGKTERSIAIKYVK